MYRTAQFEKAILALGLDIKLDEVKLMRGGYVSEFIGYLEGRRIVWTCTGEALRGRERAPELDVKPGFYE